MKNQNLLRWILVCLALACGGGAWRVAVAADVAGYSVLKGQFLLQQGSGAPTLDLDLAFSILAAVDSTDFDLVTNATLRTPSGSVKVMDNLADSWDFLDTRDKLTQLNSAYG